jgi:LuxR family maltose regulon positive regulatory protein
MFIIPLDTERKWYRYHHLFGDLLKQRLKNEEGDILKTLHQRASEWFADHDFITLAIEHAIEAGNHDRAMSLLDQTVEELWKTGQHSTIMKFGKMLKEETRKCNPNFCLYYAWILNSAGHLEEAEKILTDAEKLALADLPNSTTLLGKISVAFTYLLSSSRNTDRIFYYCEQARKFLKEDDPLWYSWAWLSYGVACVYTDKLLESGEAFEKAFEFGKKSANLYLMTTAVSRLVYGKMRLGKYKYSYDKCKELLAFFEDSGYAELAKNNWANSVLYALYGYIHYMWNKLDDALSLVQRGYELSRKGNDIYTQLSATLLYAWILLFRGDKVKTESLISAVEKSLHDKRIFNTLPFSLTGQIIKFYIKLGKFERANELIHSLGLSIQKEINYLDEMAYISYARYLIETSDYKSAESLIYKLEKLGDPGQRVESLIEIKILGAALFSLLEDKQEAKKYLNEALALGEEENLMMFFVEEMDMIGDLLNEIRSPSKFTTRITKAIEKKQKGKQEFFMDPLSTREIEVLKYMEEDLSNQEIADHIFVSINTVKTHVKNIHLKLEVKNRSSAVKKARELGMI